MATVLALSLLSPGCGPREGGVAGDSASGAPPVESAEATSFNEVAAQLDPGGRLFVFLSTRQWLEGLSAKVNEWREPLMEMTGESDPDTANEIGKGFDLISRLIAGSGIEGIDGVGVSGIAIEKELFQTKFVIHRNPESPRSGMWTLFGDNPRPLAELEWLPANTVWAAFSDFDAERAWTGLAGQLEQSGFEEAQGALQQMRAAVEQASGKSPDQWLASLGGSFGAILTLDEENPVRFPVSGNTTIEIPEPGLVIVIQVKDDAVFDWVDGALAENPQVIRTEEENLSARILPVPLPLPFQLRPTLARHGEYLFVASNEDLVKTLLAVKSGSQAGLTDREEFKRLAKEMPVAGNSFNYVSPRLGEAVQKIQRQMLAQVSRDSDGPPVEVLRKMWAMNRPTSSFMVGQSTESGWFTVGRGSQEPASLMVAPLVVAPAAIAAGLLLPALSKAKGRAQSIACVNNLKQLGLGVRLYADDHNGTFPPDGLSMRAELGSPKLWICPADPNKPVFENWEDFDESLSSYEYLGQGVDASTPETVIFRCRTHGHECLADGSVHQR
jgi:hypothetical protein